MVITYQPAACPLCGSCIPDSRAGSTLRSFLKGV